MRELSYFRILTTGVKSMANKPLNTTAIIKVNSKSIKLVLMQTLQESADVQRCFNATSDFRSLVIADITYIV